MQTVDIAIFIAYLAGIILFGISFYRKGRTSSEFTTGSGNIPAWVLGLSIFATFVSSISYLALPGIAFGGNWNAFVFSLSIPFALAAAVKFFVPLYREVGSASAYAYLETRFGPWARIYVATFWLLTQLMRIATILYLLALPMYVLLGWDMRFIILITGISVFVYSVFGGIKAVVWTDAIQAIILIGGAVATIILIMFSMPEGQAQYFEIASRHQKFSLGSFDLNFMDSTFWVVFIYGIFINLQNYGIDQNYIQRYIAARNNREAISSVMGGGLLYLPVSLLFFMIGTGLFVYYQIYPGDLPAEFRAQGMSDSIFPYFIVNAMPPGISGLLISSIFAAGMSTISTSLNSSATVFLNDYYLKIRKNASEKESLRAMYLASAIISGAGIMISFLFIRAESALQVWWNLAGIFSGGMLGLFLLGYFSKKAGNVSAAIAVLLGLLAIIWMSLSPVYFDGDLEKWRNPLHSYMTIVVGTTVIFFVGLLLTAIGSRFSSKIRSDADRIGSN